MKGIPRYSSLVVTVPFTRKRIIRFLSGRSASVLAKDGSIWTPRLRGLLFRLGVWSLDHTLNPTVLDEPLGLSQIEFGSSDI